MKETTIKFRCTGKEKKIIERLARRAGKSVSEYCREQSIYGQIIAAPK